MVAFTCLASLSLEQRTVTWEGDQKYPERTSPQEIQPAPCCVGPQEEVQKIFRQNYTVFCY